MKISMFAHISELPFYFIILPCMPLRGSIFGDWRLENE